MKRKSRIKLNFVRNWNFPGKERLANWLRSSADIKDTLKNGIVWLTNENVAIYTTADNYIEWSILSTGTYEDEINKLIRISLKTGGIALDIGGNIGLQSIRMAQSAGPAGMVYAFEPLSHLREKFIRNVTLNNISNITLLPFALSDAEGETTYQINPENWNQGTFSLRNKNTGNTAEQISIKVADELAEIQALPRLDLVKIDVEGYELPVLRGLSITLSKHKPRVIFEYDEHYWKENNQHINEAYLLLTGINYTLYQVTAVGCELIKNVSDIRGGNLLCIPNG